VVSGRVKATAGEGLREEGLVRVDLVVAGLEEVDIAEIPPAAEP